MHYSGKQGLVIDFLYTCYNVKFIDVYLHYVKRNIVNYLNFVFRIKKMQRHNNGIVGILHIFVILMWILSNLNQAESFDTTSQLFLLSSRVPVGDSKARVHF